jgi:hypothetical protein
VTFILEPGKDLLPQKGVEVKAVFVLSFLVVCVLGKEGILRFNGFFFAQHYRVLRHYNETQQ